MADLASVFVKQNDIENATDAPLTEALMTKQGSNDNYLKDELDTQDARITFIETVGFSKSAALNASLIGVNLTETTIMTVSHTSITGFTQIALENGPAGGPKGLYMDNTSNGGVLRIKRNGTQIYQLLVAGTFYTALHSGYLFTDNAAGTGANTYTLTLQAGGAGLPVIYNAVDLYFTATTLK